MLFAYGGATMQCKSCGSKWETTAQVNKCPFCGADMTPKKDPNNMDVSDVIEHLIETQGKDILKNSKQVMSYIMDLVAGHERDKKLFRVLCNNDMLTIGHKLLSVSSPVQQEIIIKKSIVTLTEEAFLSDENATTAMNLLLKGIGIIELANSHSNIFNPVQASDNKSEPSSIKSEKSFEIVASGDERQYLGAQKLIEEARKIRSTTKVEQAQGLFELLGSYKDSVQQNKACDELKLEILYEEATAEKSRALSYKDVSFIEQILNRASNMFLQIKDYKDSIEQAQDCLDLKNKLIYTIGVDTKEAADKYKDEMIYSKAVSIFSKIRGYLDADELSDYCSEQLKLAHKEVLYKKGVALSQKDDAFSLENAINCFRQITEWKDSQRLLEYCIEKKKNVPKKVIQATEQYARHNKSVSWERLGLCRYCGGEFKKKLFQVPKCRQCGQEKDY